MGASVGNILNFESMFPESETETEQPPAHDFFVAVLIRHGVHENHMQPKIHRVNCRCNQSYLAFFLKSLAGIYRLIPLILCADVRVRLS